MLDALREAGFDVLARNHAEAILRHDFPAETADLADALLDFRVSVEELIGSGGGEAPLTRRLRRRLARSGWRKHVFVVETKVDGATREAVSHEVDHVRRAAAGTLALEIEWNNKDPFFDRDLENFQRLHAMSAVSLGMILTRGARLHESMARRIEAFLRAEGHASLESLAGFGLKRRTDRQTEALARLTARGAPFASAFAKTFVADKYGEATTHWRKLEARVARGVGGPCPLLLIGLPESVVSTESPPEEDAPPSLF